VLAARHKPIRLWTSVSDPTAWTEKSKICASLRGHFASTITAPCVHLIEFRNRWFASKTAPRQATGSVVRPSAPAKTSAQTTATESTRDSDSEKTDDENVAGKPAAKVPAAQLAPGSEESSGPWDLFSQESAGASVVRSASAAKPASAAAESPDVTDSSSGSDTDSSGKETEAGKPASAATEPAYAADSSSDSDPDSSEDKKKTGEPASEVAKRVAAKSGTLPFASSRLLQLSTPVITIRRSQVR
jgi:hypothetical protein